MVRQKVHPSDHLILDDFCHTYESYHKRALNLRKYSSKLSSLHQLVCMLKSLGRVVINDEDGTVSYTTREQANVARTSLPKYANNNIDRNRNANGNEKNDRSVNSRNRIDIRSVYYDEPNQKKRVGDFI